MSIDSCVRTALRGLIGMPLCAVLFACNGTTSTTELPQSPASITIPKPGTLLVPGRQSSGGGAGGFANNGSTLSTYAISSNPSGLHFVVNGRALVTPATIAPTPPPDNDATLAITFASGFTVPIAQVFDGPHAVFYNAAGDSRGSVELSTSTSADRFPRQQRRLSTASFTIHPPPQARIGGRSDIDPGRVAVRLSASALRASGRSPQDIERAVSAHGYDTPSATTDPLRVVNVPAGIDAATLTARLRAQPEVADVEPVHLRHTLTRGATTVSDPDFLIPNQWYTFATGVNYAWSYNPGRTSKIAILDTGIDANNADLTSQLAYQETAVTPIDNTPNIANNFIPTCNPLPNTGTQVTSNSAADDNGHGTSVAGIALAKQNSAGFVGAAWGAQLIAIKIYPSQNQYCNGSNVSAATVDEARGAADAIAQGADVLSLSLGGASFDVVEFNAIENAIQLGVTVVAAAGNSEDGSVPGTLDYPAGYPGVISVGASALRDAYYSQQQPQKDGVYTTSTEIVAPYSQSAPSLSVVAPGGDAACAGPIFTQQGCDQDILHWIWNYWTSTAFLTADQCPTPAPATSCTALISGTSAATPQVAATAAMLIAEAGGRASLSPQQVLYAIQSTADNINDPRQGHGRLNAYRALASLIRDSAAYSGPNPQSAGTSQFVAFAYAKDRTNVPRIVDATFPAGVPVGADGSFRIADVPVSVARFHVAVWDDANGDGVVDVGDEIGVADVTCSATTSCALGTIIPQAVTPGYYLP